MRLQPGSAALPALDDIELVERVARNDHAAFEILMRRHNSRLFRVARAILKDAAEAEDALQEASSRPIATAASFAARPRW